MSKKTIISFLLLIIILTSFSLVSACFSDVECSNGGGWVDYGDKQVAREGCVNGQCKIIETRYVQCAKDSDCGNGEVCQKVGSINNWHCIKTSGESIQTTNTINNDKTNYAPIIIASIIGVCIIIGFIILAIILHKKK